MRSKRWLGNFARQDMISSRPADSADMAVVNTCAVTNDAASVSRSKIRQIARAGVNEIVTTGCWTTLQPQRAIELPNVTRVVTNDRKDQLVSDILDLPQEFIRS